ncbi:MAG: hypothetical protein QOE45_1853 [Frankiaceae bacterium]|jgi:hypothetical protein|nr:hypothetical protein [Frankiaceae bacterium]
MPYRTSPPLAWWLGARREAIDALRAVHAAVGPSGGVGRPLAQAYVIRVVAEFQAFARDLHDLGAELLVTLADLPPRPRYLLTNAATANRLLDRGNADLRCLVHDFGRIGIDALGRQLVSANPRWAGGRDRRGDRALYGDLLELRNCLAHGNERQLERLRARGVEDTIVWARARLPALNRLARTLDRILWETLVEIYRKEPW